MPRNLVRLTALLIAVSAAAISAESSYVGGWHVDLDAHRVFAVPDPIWRAADSAFMIDCVKGMPSVSIRVRNEVAARPKVRLQFGGTGQKLGSFVGKGGVIREWTFARGKERRTAIANPRDSAEIVKELRREPTRVAYVVGMEDGYDSLEVKVFSFVGAWEGVHCEKR